MMAAYHVRYVNDCEFVPESVEDEFQIPIYNLKSNSISKSRTFQLAGKQDVKVSDANANRWVIDHKTCSEDIGPEAVYWPHLAVEGQASLYLLAEHVAGRRASGAVWDVIRKVGIIPKTVNKADCTAITSVGFYCGEPVSDETQAYIIKTAKTEKAVRENAELYEIRVRTECLEKPARHFQRRRVPRLQDHLVAYAHELWELTQEVLATRRRHRQMGVLPVRNSGACMNYGMPCTYLGICSGYDSPDSDRWRKRESVHEELKTLEGDGRNVLTHSRLRCFQTCKRKHYFRYELGIERQDRQPSDALYFGTIMHAGLEAWWRYRLPLPIGENNGNSDGKADGKSQSVGKQCTQDDVPF
jgi:hypothetical protein